jgi:hypothetical protein
MSPAPPLSLNAVTIRPLASTDAAAIAALPPDLG